MILTLCIIKTPSVPLTRVRILPPMARVVVAYGAGSQLLYDPKLEKLLCLVTASPT